MRLIDKDELRKKALIVDDLCEANLGFYIIPAPVFDKAPTIDAVEVIRCSECIYKFLWFKDEFGSDICGLSGMYPRSENDYCCYGERRTDP